MFVCMWVALHQHQPPKDPARATPSLKNVHPPLLQLILHFAFSASMGASQPYSVSLDTAGCASHCCNGQRGKANSISTRKSITKELDIKEAFKSAAWHRAGEAWVSAPDLRGGSAGRGAFASPLTPRRRARELFILRHSALMVNKKVKLERRARQSFM